MTCLPPSPPLFPYTTLFRSLLLYPVFWLVMSSFKVSEDIFITAESFIPKPFILSNYSQWWEGFGGHSFGVFIKNTLVFVAFVLVGHFISCSLIAFGFARLNFVGRGFWFGVMIFTLMLPYEVIMIPQYIIFAKLGWLNSLKPLVVPAYFGHPFFIFLLVRSEERRVGKECRCGWVAEDYRRRIS